ncbi:MAG TPA: periplasmic heavy metal sensor [Thermoanaerobaculia bacterium]
MSIRQIRNTVLVAVGICALAIAGIFAGRMSADAIPLKSRGDFAPRMFARISRALDLTSDQQAAVKGVLRNHADEIAAQMTASRAARRALREAVMASPTDEATIRARAADAGRVQGDGAVLFAKIRTELDPILTPDQRDKARAFQSRFRDRGENSAESLKKFLGSSP